MSFSICSTQHNRHPSRLPASSSHSMKSWFSGKMRTWALPRPDPHYASSKSDGRRDAPWRLQAQRLRQGPEPEWVRGLHRHEARHVEHRGVGPVQPFFPSTPLIQPLTLAPWGCGRVGPEVARFWSACGSPLVATPLFERSARKTVTVVFADIAGSPELGDRLDPGTGRQVLEGKRGL